MTLLCAVCMIRYGKLDAQLYPGGDSAALVSSSNPSQEQALLHSPPHSDSMIVAQQLCTGKPVLLIFHSVSRDLRTRRTRVSSTTAHLAACAAYRSANLNPNPTCPTQTTAFFPKQRPI